MNHNQFEEALDEIVQSIPIGEDVEKLANKANIGEFGTPAFKAGALAVSCIVLKKFEEIYIKMIEDGCT